MEFLQSRFDQYFVFLCSIAPNVVSLMTNEEHGNGLHIARLKDRIFGLTTWGKVSYIQCTQY